MSVLNNLKGVRSANYGTSVTKSAAVLPATGNQTLFTIAGGRVIITSLVGQVTTAASATATNLKLTAVGPNAVTTDLCSNVAITSAVVGTLMAPTAIGAAGQVGAAVTQNNEVVVNTGTIRVTSDATNTGAMSWTISYIPLDDGASVTAA